ncbi:hypothetical protein ACIRPT_05655 [Streptomyces sp. NPDC101227]|uniref:hypothetical protein n=1 Tax=Streptomyces sp. NPDC101227 TaxID=3366136 RepID=UPI003814C624
MSARTRPIAARQTGAMARPLTGAAPCRPVCGRGATHTLLCGRITPRCGGATRLGCSASLGALTGGGKPTAGRDGTAGAVGRRAPRPRARPSAFAALAAFDAFGDLGVFAPSGRVVTSPSRTGRPETSGSDGAAAMV